VSKQGAEMQHHLIIKQCDGKWTCSCGVSGNGPETWETAHPPLSREEMRKPVALTYITWLAATRTSAQGMIDAFRKVGIDRRAQLKSGELIESFSADGFCDGMDSAAKQLEIWLDTHLPDPQRQGGAK
jgi:hypothetical protein